MENSNEAPASITYSITSKDGFNALFTVRDDMVKNLFIKMEVVEKTLLDKGYKPQVKQSFERKPFVPQPSASGNFCPKCHAPMAMSKAGKEYCSKLCWKNQTTNIPTVGNNDFTAF